LIVVAYNFKGWKQSYEVIFVAGTEWVFVILVSGLILFYQSDFIKKLAPLKKTKL